MSAITKFLWERGPSNNADSATLEKDKADPLYVEAVSEYADLLVENKRLKTDNNNLSILLAKKHETYLQNCAEIDKLRSEVFVKKLALETSAAITAKQIMVSAKLSTELDIAKMVTRKAELAFHEALFLANYEPAKRWLKRYGGTK
jgi:hypothetical protein